MTLPRITVSLIAAALCVGLLAAPALGGKKKKTAVVFNSGSPSKSGGNVKARGSLRSTTGCIALRGVKLFLTDANGAVLATLDSKSTDENGNWNLSGRIPSTIPNNAIFYVQVKAIKRSVNKAVCRAGFSPIVQLTR